MARISSGKRINYASDDPTGVGQLTMAKASLGGARQAQMNVQQDLAMLQFADGVMQTFEDKVIQLRDLAIRGANDATLSTTQQSSLNQEFTTGLANLSSGRMGAITWNGKTIMTTATAAMNFQYGGQSGDVFTLTTNALRMNSTNQGAGGTDFSGGTVDTAANSLTALGNIDTALTGIATARATVGSAMERLEYALEEQMTMETNYAAAVSTIGDADIAAEISKLTTSQILSQSASAMLGQANIHAQTLLNILM